VLAFADTELDANNSGGESHSGRMTKCGSSQLCYTLINCSLPLIRFNMKFTAYYTQKPEQGKFHRVAITHVTKKLVRVIHALERQNVDFNVQKLPIYISFSKFLLHLKYGIFRCSVNLIHFYQIKFFSKISWLYIVCYLIFIIFYFLTLSLISI